MCVCMPLGIKMVADCLHYKVTLVFVFLSNVAPFLPQEGGRNSKCTANQNAGGQVMGDLLVICYRAPNPPTPTTCQDPNEYFR